MIKRKFVFGGRCPGTASARTQEKNDFNYRRHAAAAKEDHFKKDQ